MLKSKHGNKTQSKTLKIMSTIGKNLFKYFVLYADIGSVQTQLCQFSALVPIVGAKNTHLSMISKKNFFLTFDISAHVTDENEEK